MPDANHASDNKIRSKLCLITGASGGIGKAIARQLILHDVDLALHYSTNQLAIEELVAQLRHEHEVQRPDAGYLRISTHQADLSVAEQVLSLVEEVRLVKWSGDAPLGVSGRDGGRWWVFQRCWTCVGYGGRCSGSKEVASLDPNGGWWGQVEEVVQHRWTRVRWGRRRGGSKEAGVSHLASWMRA